MNTREISAEFIEEVLNKLARSGGRAQDYFFRPQSKNCFSVGVSAVFS